MIYRLLRQQVIPAPMKDVWAYFSAPQNLNELTPPDMNFEIIHCAEEEMYAGQLIEYRVEFVRGIKTRWLTEIAHVSPEAYFVDEQQIGPYKFWYHEHKFLPQENGIEMTDVVTYALPFGVVGRVVHGVWVKRRLNQIFDYLYQKIEQVFGQAPMATLQDMQ